MPIITPIMLLKDGKDFCFPLYRHKAHFTTKH
nr:MAG TPA: hypothetical protein [Caudoviricetes sp.]